MDVDVTVEDLKEVKDGKRTKWLLPPSHHALFSSLSVKVGKQQQFSKSEGSELGGAVESNGVEDNLHKVAISLEAMAEALCMPRIAKVNQVAKAEICPKIRRARLIGTKGIAAKIREQYGYEISNTTYLYSEEAMHLLELGKLEVWLGKVPLSVERARGLLLHSRKNPNCDSIKVKTCSLDEYIVYKHLSELGYRIRRRDSDLKPSHWSGVSSPTPRTMSPSGSVQMAAASSMELDEEPMAVENEEINSSDNRTIFTQPVTSQELGDFGQRGMKRKFVEVIGEDTQGSTSSSAKDMSDNEDADEELELSQSNVGDAHMEGQDESVYFHPSASEYTVTEADSDVEILEDAIAGPSSGCRNGVYIEEVGFGYEGDTEDISSQEPQPSTSAACFSSCIKTDVSQVEAVVDLADSETEDDHVPASFSRIWNKFVPNTTIQIGYPPSCLLPSSIPAKDTIYEFDLKSRESARSDTDLEYFVDELSLDPSPGETTGNHKTDRQACRSWKEWRQGAVNEAHGVLSASLLGQSNIVKAATEDPMHKLHLWGQKEPEYKRRVQRGWNDFRIPFELYHPSVGFNKNNSRKEVLPSYLVAVVRNDEHVPSFTTCDPLINGVPVLIAVVGDESNIMFVNPEGSPIPSLF